MRDDVSGVAGLAGGTASRNQPRGGSGDAGYADAIRSCVLRGVTYPLPPQGSSNPTLQYRVSLQPNGRPSRVQLLRSSGNPRFDEAVRKGVEACSPFPVPPGGKYPAYIDIEHRMYD